MFRLFCRITISYYDSQFGFRFCQNCDGCFSNLKNPFDTVNYSILLKRNMLTDCEVIYLTNSNVISTVVI